MGAWGIKPFENDSILDDMGMFQFADELVADIEKYLHMDRNYYPGYEFTALLASTYIHGAKQHFIIGENKIMNIMKALDKDILTKEEKDLFYESSKAWTSACSIPLIERKELLKKCANKLKDELDNPRTGNEYFEKDKFILYMKHVYTTAQEILNSVNNKPAYISKERFERLFKAYDNKCDADMINAWDMVTVRCHYAKDIYEIEDAKGELGYLPKNKIITLIKNGKVNKPTDKELLDTFGKYFNNNVLLVCCVDKLYKGNKIVAYLIEDQHGRRNEVTPEQLKDAIRNKIVECTNLTLTSDNRLISKTGL